MPTSGKGSQCSEMTLQIKLCEFSRDFFECRKKEWLKDNKPEPGYEPFKETLMFFGDGE